MPHFNQTAERLQKYLANLGLGSRRQIETWIVQGRVRVDGQPATLGQRVTAHSQIRVDGRRIHVNAVPPTTRLLAYNKPEGEICSRCDPHNRPLVFHNLPKLKGQRWVAVGRLDLNTRGLLLFTNDGALAQRLMHPQQALEREYLCRIFGEVTPTRLDKLTRGVLIDGKKSAFRRVKRNRGHGKNTWYSVVVTQGRYREVRRVWEAIDCQVSRLIRVRFADITLPKHLRPGHWLELKPSAVAQLAARLETPPPRMR